MSDVLAFLSIERSLGQIAYRAMEHTVAPLEKKVVAAVQDGDHGAAFEAVQHVNLDHVAELIRNDAPFYVESAFRLGASLAYGSLAKTPRNVVDQLPDRIRDAAVSVHAGIVSHRTSALIHSAVVTTVSDMETEAKEDQYAAKHELLVAKIASTDIAARLNAAVNGTAQMMSSISANLTTSRLVSYGFLVSAQATGVVRYQLQAILDRRTSQICRTLDGRVFEVSQALQFQQNVLETTEPEALKAIAPFISGNKAALEQLKSLSDEELQARGVMVPPFHPNCRTILVPAGEDITLDSATAEPVQPTATDTSITDQAAALSTDTGGATSVEDVLAQQLTPAVPQVQATAAAIDDTIRTPLEIFPKDVGEFEYRVTNALTKAGYSLPDNAAAQMAKAYEDGAKAAGEVPGRWDQWASPAGRQAVSDLVQNWGLDADMNRVFADGVLRTANTDAEKDLLDKELTRELKSAKMTISGDDPLSESLRRYQGSAYEYINGILRGAKQWNEVPATRHDQVKKWIRALEQFFGNKGDALRLRYDTRVFRGAELSIDPEKLRPGVTVSDKGALSTSIDNEVPISFLTKNEDLEPGRSNYYFEIRLPAGQKAYYYGEGEREVLLPPGTDFKVVSIQREKIAVTDWLPEGRDVWHVVMEAIPDLSEDLVLKVAR